MSRATIAVERAARENALMATTLESPTPQWQPRLGVTPEWIRLFCERWGVAEFALFGSVLRDDFRADSDVDILIQRRSGRLLDPEDWLGMEDELAGAFGRKVDVINKDALRNPFVRHAILTTYRIVHAA